MLELCRAIIVAPTAFDSQALAEVAEQVGFGDIASIFSDAESNGLKYPVSYFLVHHRLADIDCEDVVYAVRRIERNGLRYSPMIMMIANAPSEAAGKYACEYMTRGRVLILGPIENEIGSGMTGGELFIFDPETEVPAKLHGKSVTVIDCSHVDYEWMHPLLHQYFARTGSRQAEHILKNWAEIRRGRRLKKILPLAVALAMEDLKTAGTNAG